MRTCVAWFDVGAEEAVCLADVASCGLLTTWVDWSTVKIGGRAEVACSTVGTRRLK